MTCNGLASHPGEVEILLAASCYRNQDKLRQLWASLWLQGFTQRLMVQLEISQQLQGVSKWWCSKRLIQLVCSHCCQLLCYRLISWLCVYSQWNNKDCLQTRNVKVEWCSGDYLPLHHHKEEPWCNDTVCVDQVIMVSIVINESPWTALQCALCCDCSAEKTTKF